MQALREMRHHSILAHEQTKRDLAKIIHTQVQGRLLVLEYWLKDCQGLLKDGPKDVVELLGNARSILGDIIEQDLRPMTSSLYPAVIRNGLLSALNSLAARFHHMFDVEIEADEEMRELDGSVSPQLSHDMRLTLYRIVEEALNNVAKHSQARKVKISLGASPETGIRLTIQDDGMGFDVARMAVGNGLLFMEEYAEALGAELEVDSNPGHGTTVSIASPCLAMAT